MEVQGGMNMPRSRELGLLLWLWPRPLAVSPGIHSYTLTQSVYKPPLLSSCYILKTLWDSK